MVKEYEPGPAYDKSLGLIEELVGEGHENNEIIRGMAHALAKFTMLKVTSHEVENPAEVARGYLGHHINTGIDATVEIGKPEKK
jgi:hypothetical protein